MPLIKPKAETAGKPAKPKKAKPPKEKKPKAPKEKKPKKPKPPKGKKVKKGQNPPADGAELPEEGGQPKKKKLILLLIPVVVIAAAALIFLFVIRPRLAGDDGPDASASVEPEPQPPELPDTIPIGDDVTIKGLALGADESGAQVVKSKRVVYTYTNLNDAGKAAQTYAGQLAAETPAFALVDEEFVRLKDQPDYTTEEGMVLFARNVPVEAPKESAAPASASPAPEESGDPDASAEPTPTPTPEPDPEPTPEPITYVHTVRITWSPGTCVVTADEEVGKVTSPPSSTPAKRPLTQRGAVDRLKSMDPADLGLNGTSMSQYEIIAMDGTEMMDGRACYRLHAYGISDNYQVMGSYLISIDGEHLYRLDPVAGEAVELDYTPE